MMRIQEPDLKLVAYWIRFYGTLYSSGTDLPQALKNLRLLQIKDPAARLVVRA